METLFHGRQEELKFSKNKIKYTVIDYVKQKIDRIMVDKKYSFRPVLIHVNGVENSVVESDHFVKIIDFCQLLT